MKGKKRDHLHNKWGDAHELGSLSTMAYDSVRAMMDSLMGADRDASQEEKEKNKRAFDDPTVLSSARGVICSDSKVM